MHSERLDAIPRYLYSHGASSIQALADAIGASLATVRRDLQVLEQQGIISRTHGGARIANSAEVEVAFAVREKQNLFEKRAIGAAAYELLKPHSSVFLDAGTTVLQLARCLRVRPLPLAVFTNGLIAAQELMNIPKLMVSVIGGQVRNENASLVGPAAEAALDRLWFDQLFLGASAIGDDNRIYGLDAAEAHLNAQMRSRAANTTVLTDSSKFGRRATHVVCDLDNSISIITDDELSPDWQADLRENGAKLSVVHSFATPGSPDRIAAGESA